MSRLLSLALLVCALALPGVSMAQGKIAVVDLKEAILQTDVAKKRLTEIRNEKDYKANKSEFDKLQAEFEKLVKKLQKDAAVMSQEQQVAARQKLATKQGDLEHVTGKLRQAEQVAGQALLNEMGPNVEAVLRDIIEAEGIGLLLQRGSVIHADAGYNITAKVTEKLNKRGTKK